MSASARRVVLHIGLEKTGTTSIQSFLNDNRELLKAAGVYVPLTPLSDVPDTKSHLKLSAYARAQDRPDDVRLRLGITDLRHFRSQFQAAFVKECLTASCSTIVLSSEHCSSRLHHEHELEQLKRLLEMVGEPVIVVFVRRQDEALVSAYHTAVRLGSTRKLCRPSDHEIEEMYDYKTLCLRWANVFGKSAIRVQVFDPRFYRNPEDLINQFAAAAEIVVTPNMGLPSIANESLDWTTIEFLRQLNGYLPHLLRENSLPDPRQGNLLNILARLSDPKAKMTPDAIAYAFYNEFAAGNEYVAREICDLHDGVLFMQKPEVEASSAADELTLVEALKIFASIWSESNVPGSGAKLRPIS